MNLKLCSIFRFQQIVSIGTFELVVLLNVLFVIDSPIDANPFDELEWCWPCVVLSFERLFFGVKNLAIADITYGIPETKKCYSSVLSTTTIYYDVNWVCLLAAAMQQPRKSIRLAMHLFHPLYTRNNNECHHLLNAYLNFSWYLNQNSKQYEPTIAHQLPMLSPLQSLISYTLFPMRHCKHSNQTIKFRYKNAYMDWL